METVMDGQMTLLLAFHVVRIQEFDNSGSVDLIFATALQYYVIVFFILAQGKSLWKLEGETCGTCVDPSNNFDCGECAGDFDCESDLEDESRPYFLFVGVEERFLPSRCRLSKRKS